MIGIFKEPAQTSPVLGLTVWVRRAHDGRCDLDLHSYRDDGEPVVRAKITCDTAAAAVDWAERYDTPIVGMVVRRGVAAREGEMQHGEHVIVVPDALELGMLAEMWISLDKPGEDCDMEHDPVPQTNLADDVWRWLRLGLMSRMGDNPHLHQAYLDASADALYMEDGETGELTIVDCRDGEGLSIQVFDGNSAWSIPLDGSDPEVL